MSFEPIRSGRGQPRVKGICDDCAREEVVAAVHGKSGRDGEGQAVNKLQGMGWTYVGKRLRCPSCAAKAKRAASPDPQDSAEQVADDPVVVDLPRQPSREDKRKIMDLLADVYDTEAECYRRGDTDETVADVLDVMPGWVAQLRDEFFGPSGGNHDMAALAEDLAEFSEHLTVLRAKAVETLDAVDGGLQAVKAMQGRLRKIETAVGRRIMAGVKG